MNKFKKGDLFIVNFALGPATVKLLEYKYKMYDGETVYHVEDVKTGHQDTVGETWLIPVKEGE